jgi:hypothetical protein
MLHFDDIGVTVRAIDVGGWQEARSTRREHRSFLASGRHCAGRCFSFVPMLSSFEHNHQHVNHHEQMYIIANHKILGYKQAVDTVNRNTALRHDGLCPECLGKSGQLKLIGDILAAVQGSHLRNIVSLLTR